MLLFDSLERRELLAFSAHINFQTADAPVPPHYRADTGTPYAAHRNGLRYGWSEYNRAQAVDRNSANSPDQRYDTFNSLTAKASDGTTRDLNWQIALPNGTYNVHIVAGDPSAGSSPRFYRINAENVWVANGTTDPKSGTRFIEGTQTITIADRHLKISRGDGSSFSQINFIDITPARRNLVKSYIEGIDVNVGTSPDRAIPVLKQLGVKGVRVWSDIKTWAERRIRPAYKQVRKYEAAGFNVTLLIECHFEPTYAESKAFFDWVQTVPRIRKSVDRWEIGNEPNITKYYQGTLRGYVSNYLRGAYDSLHANGEPVIGAALTPDQSQMRYLVSLGYLNYLDYANVHPYSTTVAQQQKVILDAKDIYAGRPLTCTEWNFQFLQENNAQWPQMLKEQHEFVKANLESAFYYRFAYGGRNSGDAVAGLVNPDMTPHQPFFDTYMSFNLPTDAA